MAWVAGTGKLQFDGRRIHDWIQVLCQVPEALGKGQITLGKAFAECGTRQRIHGKKLISKALFAECILSDTRQRLCRVPRGHSAKKSDRYGAEPVDGHFAECQPCRHLTNIFLFFLKKILCRVPTLQALGKDLFYFFKKILCRVPTSEALGKDFLFFFKFLCRVPTCETLGKELLFFFENFLWRVPTLQALGKDVLFF